MNSKKSYQIKMITFTALFAALIAVATSFIKVPSSHGGYMHAGDSMIYLAACILPPGYSVIASAIGGFFADIIAGAPHWAIPTAIIKSINALPFIACRYFLKKHNKDNKILHPANIAMLIPTSLVTIIGYFLAEGIMYGFEVSFISAFIGGWIQPLAGAVVYLAVGAALDAVNFKTKIYSRLLKSGNKATSNA